MKFRALRMGLLLVPLLLASVPKARYWSGSAAGVAIHWDQNDLTFSRPPAAPFFSAKRAFRGNISEDTGCNADGTARLLSVVGPVASFETQEDGYCFGAAHPFAHRGFETLDLRRANQPAKLTDFFPEQDVLKALLGDRLIQKALQGKKRPQTLKAFFDVLKDYMADDCLYGFPPEMLNHFAFHHLEGKYVAVRIGLEPTCEIARGQLTQLGLLLPVSPVLSQALAQAASKKRGFLMQAAPARDSRFTL
jgi:hypothetical protein